MNIGIFDSGLGGLVILKSLVTELPDYNYIYLGDTRHMPYGSRDQKAILQFTQAALKTLFAQGCSLVIIACNTSSAKALRKIQREFLPRYYPDRKVLGVIIPTVEAVAEIPKLSRVGILATPSTVQSKTYLKEFKKIKPAVTVTQSAAKDLAAMIETDDQNGIHKQLPQYLRPLLAQRPQAIVLGCTHYPLVKKQITALAGPGIKIICQDEIISHKLKKYLVRHPEINKLLARGHKRRYFATKLTKDFETVSKKLFGRKILIETL